MLIAHPCTGAPMTDRFGGAAYVDLRSRDDSKASLRSRMGGAFEDDEVAHDLASISVGWRLLGFDGRPLDIPFSAEAARQLFAARGMSWLRRQIAAFVAERESRREAKVLALIAFAEDRFKGDRPVGTGGTERDHAASAARIRKGLGAPPRSEPPKPRMPAEMAYLWRAFIEMSYGLEASSYGPAVASWSQVEVWARVMGYELKAWEALALVRLGRVRAWVMSAAAEG